MSDAAWWAYFWHQFWLQIGFLGAIAVLILAALWAKIHD